MRAGKVEVFAMFEGVAMEQFFDWVTNKFEVPIGEHFGWIAPEIFDGYLQNEVI